MRHVDLFVEAGRLGDEVELASLDESLSSHPWTQAQFLEELLAEGPRRVTLIRHVDEETLSIVAFVVLHVVADEACVRSIAVARSHWRRGLARRLLGIAMRLARGRGASVLLLEVRESNSAARQLYESEGFVEVGRRRRYYCSPAEDAVVLTLSLGRDLEMAGARC